MCCHPDLTAAKDERRCFRWDVHLTKNAFQLHEVDVRNRYLSRVNKTSFALIKMCCNFPGNCASGVPCPSHGEGHHCVSVGVRIFNGLHFVFVHNERDNFSWDKLVEFVGFPWIRQHLLDFIHVAFARCALDFWCVCFLKTEETNTSCDLGFLREISSFNANLLVLWVACKFLVWGCWVNNCAKFCSFNKRKKTGSG